MIETAVPFGDLKRHTQSMRAELDEAIARVLDSGWYILGSEVSQFEEAFAAYCGVEYCVGVASGAEALYLALAAYQIGPGDEVVTVANACMYEVSAIVQAGATPVLADVDPDTQNMSVAAFEAAITPRTRAVIPVHLFGRLADMDAICALAEQHGIVVIEDAAQAHGSWRADRAGQQRRAGGWGNVACFSFYPSKNLGALGDAGALVTNDKAVAERLRRLRMYGWASKYMTVDAGGRNSRLDTLQAAILGGKLGHLHAGNAARRERAGWYEDRLTGLGMALPQDEPGHIYHLYVVTLPSNQAREELRQALTAAQVGCDVHYPTPAHLQPAFANLGYGPGSLPVTENLAGRILSLPMFAELTSAEVARVAEVCRGALA